MPTQIQTRIQTQISALKKQIAHLTKKLDDARSSYTKAQQARDDALTINNSADLDAAIQTMSDANRNIGLLKSNIEVAAQKLEELKIEAQNEEAQTERDAEAKKMSAVLPPMRKAASKIDHLIQELSLAIDDFVKTIPDFCDISLVLKEHRSRSPMTPQKLAGVVLAEALNDKMPQFFEESDTYSDGPINALIRRGNLSGELSKHSRSFENNTGLEAANDLIINRINQYTIKLLAGEAEPGEYAYKQEPQTNGSTSSMNTTVKLSLHLPVSFKTVSGDKVTKDQCDVLVPSQISRAMVESGRATYAKPQNEAEESANEKSKQKLSEIYANEGSLSGRRIDDLPVPYFSLA